MDIPKVQSVLRESKTPAWLLYSFFGSNPVALDFLGFSHLHLSRRFAYLIPAQGEPTLIVHAIEQSTYPPLPGKKRVFHSLESFKAALQEVVAPYGRVAMEYQPGGSIPYLSRVDAGTIELLRGMGLEVVSSAEILLQFQTWSAEALASHKRAVQGIEAAIRRALDFIRSRITDPPSELEVQAEISKVFEARGLVFDHPAMVDFGPHAANPHHTPGLARLERGQVVLIDLWCKEPGGPYADVTWMAGWDVPQEVHQAFAVVTKARDRAVEYVAQAYREGRHPKGFEVDQAAREVLEGAGFGAYILHRTGHNLGFSATHGNGTHLDGLETHDTRPLIPGLAFTVEPGIYPQGIASATSRDGSLGPWGLRSEINVYLHESGPEITTGVQREIDRL